MEVILLEKVENLGSLGDRVQVKPGYGRNFLIPSGKATPATEEHIKAFEARRAELEKATADVLAEAEARRDKLEGLTVTIKAKAGAGTENRMLAEGQALLTAMPDRGWSVALDRRGKAYDSPQLATWLQARLEASPDPIVFLLGSDLGLHPKVLDRVRDRLSFGPMTLPHELARLVLYEQIYRAFCITAGIKYHRGPL